MKLCIQHEWRHLRKIVIIYKLEIGKSLYGKNAKVVNGIVKLPRVEKDFNFAGVSWHLT